LRKECPRNTKVSRKEFVVPKRCASTRERGAERIGEPKEMGGFDLEEIILGDRGEGIWEKEKDGVQLGAGGPETAGNFSKRHGQKGDRRKKSKGKRVLSLHDELSNPSHAQESEGKSWGGM